MPYMVWVRSPVVVMYMLLICEGTVDGRIVADSQHVLVQLVSTENNHGQQFPDAHHTMKLVEHGKAREFR